MENWKSDLDCVFNPRNIAFIGASKNVAKWGHIILGNIVAGHFSGEIYPINPREEWIMERKVYRSVGEVPADEIDLAVIVTPSKTVPGILHECAAANVRGAIVVPGGFSEEGGEGAGLEKEIARIAEENKIRLVGPNTMGVYSGRSSLYAMMPPVRPKPGPVAFVAQSGNLGTQMMSIGQRKEIGFSKFAASGNEASTAAKDYIEYFGRDADTRVILAYIEGLKQGREFIDIASGITREKPLIVFKGGKTASGMKAASSHTGAMAGSAQIYEAAFKQCGAVIASTPNEMLDLAWAFAELPLPRSNRVGILTWGGGWGVVTADACESAGLELPPLSEKTISAIDKLLPPYWSRNNPIDLVGTLDRDNHIKCLEALLADDGIDAAIVLGVVGGSTLVTAHVETMMGAPAAVQAFVEHFKEVDRQIETRLLELTEQYNKPIVGVAVASDYKPYHTDRGRIVVAPRPHMAVNMIASMVGYKKYRDSLEEE